MEDKKKKCPLCSKKLVMRDGVPTCPDCGYRDPYRSGSGQSRTDDNPQQTVYSQPPGGNQNQQQGYSQQSQATPGSQPKLGPYAAVVTPSANVKGKKGNSAGMVVGIVAAVVVMTIGGLVAVMTTLYDTYNTVMDESGRGGYGSSESSRQSSSAPEAQQSSASSSRRENSSVSHLTFDPPESEFLQEFVSQLFDKPAASVTREDLNSVTGIVIRDLYNYNGTEIWYELSDGTEGSCYLSAASSRVDTEDFKCFPMLQTLNLGRSTLDWDTDWHGLTSLTSLTCGGSLEDLAERMDVSQLTALDLDCDFLMGDLSGLEECSNLEVLRLDGGGHALDLEGLSRAADLKTLIIADGDGISDFSELYDMPQLKELSIESKGLKDIGFVCGMTGLESLELRNTQLMWIGTISDCADTLKSLRLHQNYSVADYSPVFDCTGLEELELYVQYDFDHAMEMPDLSMMTELKSLTLGNYDSFPGLGGLTSLESLTLADASTFGNSNGLMGLEGLTHLKSLALIDMSVEPDFLEAFAVVESLENVDLEESFIWGDINALFSLPNLQTLNLEWAAFGLRLEEMPVSESLRELNMAGTAVHQLNGDGSWNYSAGNTRISLGGYTEFFDHMPELTALTVTSQELQDVEFAGNMTQLVYLNIGNNYVTDLSPLAGLGQLQLVLCENNPVHDRTGLKNVIIID